MGLSTVGLLLEGHVDLVEMLFAVNWIDVTHSMQRGILCAMSSVLKFCFSSAFTQSSCAFCLTRVFA